MKKKNRSIWLITGVLIMLIAGSVYTWTIISRSIAATFPDWSAQTLSMTFTITMMGYAAGGMVSGVLLKKTGPKVILALGAVLFSGGMMLSSFAQTPGLLYIGFGAMCGLATGLCYNSTVSTVSAWFPDMQGVASGTLLAGFGMSSFIAGKLYTGDPGPGDTGSGDHRHANPERGRSGCGSRRLRQGRLFEKESGQGTCKRYPYNGDGQEEYFLDLLYLDRASDCLRPHACLPGERYCRRSRNDTFRQYYCDGSRYDLHPECGRPDLHRDCRTGTVYDRFGYRVTMLMVMVFFGFSAVMMILAIKTGVFALVVIGFAAGGFAYGGNASISPPMIADFYGRTWYATNFALIPTNALFTSFASVLAGRIYDQTHSYLYPLLLLLGAIVLSAVISLMIRRPGEKSLAGSES